MLADGEVDPSRSTTSPRPRPRLQARGIEAVAILLLHSYRNPAHERARRDRAEEPPARSSRPRAVAGISRVRALSRPSPRTPISARASRAISARSSSHLRPSRLRRRFHVVQSTGGLFAVEQAQARLRAHAGIGPGGGRHRRAGDLRASSAWTMPSPSTWAAPRPRPASSTNGEAADGRQRVDRRL